VEDIRNGTLNEKITEPEMRAAVEKTLQPNPDLASRVEEECSKKDWEGILPRLFPNARFVACVISGSMLQYAPALKHFSGHLSMISPVYAACECSFIGLNPNMTCAPEDIAYMLWPETAYYEFIPQDDDGVEQFDDGGRLKALEACDLEVGKAYELVVTNVIGKDLESLSLNLQRQSTQIWLFFSRALETVSISPEVEHCYHQVCIGIAWATSSE
jgi:hypothetical protein